MIDGSVLQSVLRCFEKKSRVVVKMVVINLSRITQRKRKTGDPHEVHESSPHNGIMPILTFILSAISSFSDMKK